tara:strand:- start:883 stop:1194 length:312 start_codon:yes stop_codon:yes gene_type:complete
MRTFKFKEKFIFRKYRGFAFPKKTIDAMDTHEEIHITVLRENGDEAFTNVTKGWIKSKAVKTINPGEMRRWPGDELFEQGQYIVKMNDIVKNQVDKNSRRLDF